MTDTVPTTTPQTAEELRRALVEKLKGSGTLTDPRVEVALLSVPRHAFVPRASVEEAYANTTVSIKDDQGGSISCASQPGVVTTMLQQAALEPGMRVLEVGAGTGYNAALLSHLVGPTGSVTTLDIDQDLVDGARVRLAETGAANVQVRCTDGALGDPVGAPYDRIIATVGCHHIPQAWAEQLAPGGLLIAPVRVIGDVSYSIVFRAEEGRWRSTSAELCTFMPLRGGIGDDPRCVLDLTGDHAVRLQVNQDQCIVAEQVYGVLDAPAETLWTGVYLGGMEPWDKMWLWLALTLDNRVSRLLYDRTAVDNGLLARGLGWGTMASVPVDDRGLVYLTFRMVDIPDGRGSEVGVVSHASAGRELARRMAAQVLAWSQRRGQVPTYALHPKPGPLPTAEPGEFLLDRGPFHLVVSWGAPDR